MSILSKIQQYYKRKKISACRFDCPCIDKCNQSKSAIFTTGHEPFVGTKYDRAGNRSFPRILFVSLDPVARDHDSGRVWKEAEHRTAKRFRVYFQREWEFKKKEKNRHWFQTHAFAWRILKGFYPKSESELTREIDSYFAAGQIVGDPETITAKVRKHVTPYFAHTNSAKCSQNKNRHEKSDQRLFTNCRNSGFLAGELKNLEPDIVVTQGAEARLAVINAIDGDEIVLHGREMPSTGGRRALTIAGDEVLWIHTYHAGARRKFFEQKKRYWPSWARIATDWYKQKEEKKLAQILGG